MKSASNDSTANLGFEAKLWLAGNKLRNNMDAAEQKHAVLLPKLLSGEVRVGKSEKLVENVA
jgi:hypothetical protein